MKAEEREKEEKMAWEAALLNVEAEMKAPPKQPQTEAPALEDEYQWGADSDSSSTMSSSRERESSPYITAPPNEMDNELSTNSSMKDDESGSDDETEDGLESVEPSDRSNQGDDDTPTDQLGDYEQIKLPSPTIHKDDELNDDAEMDSNMEQHPSSVDTDDELVGEEREDGMDSEPQNKRNDDDERKVDAVVPLLVDGMSDETGEGIPHAVSDDDQNGASEDESSESSVSADDSDETGEGIRNELPGEDQNKDSEDSSESRVTEDDSDETGNASRNEEPDDDHNEDNDDIHESRVTEDDSDDTSEGKRNDQPGDDLNEENDDSSESNVTEGDSDETGEGKRNEQLSDDHFEVSEDNSESTVAEDNAEDETREAKRNEQPGDDHNEDSDDSFRVARDDAGDGTRSEQADDDGDEDSDEDSDDSPARSVTEGDSDETGDRIRNEESDDGHGEDSKDNSESRVATDDSDDAGDGIRSEQPNDDVDEDSDGSPARSVTEDDSDETSDGTRNEEPDGDHSDYSDESSESRVAEDDISEKDDSTNSTVALTPIDVDDENNGGSAEMSIEADRSKSKASVPSSTAELEANESQSSLEKIQTEECNEKEKRPSPSSCVLASDRKAGSERSLISAIMVSSSSENILLQNLTADPRRTDADESSTDEMKDQSNSDEMDERVEKVEPCNGNVEPDNESSQRRGDAPPDQIGAYDEVESLSQNTELIDNDEIHVSMEHRLGSEETDEELESEELDDEHNAGSDGRTERGVSQGDPPEDDDAAKSPPMVIPVDISQGHHSEEDDPAKSLPIVIPIDIHDEADGKSATASIDKEHSKHNRLLALNEKKQVNHDWKLSPKGILQAEEPMKEA